MAINLTGKYADEHLDKVPAGKHTFLTLEQAAEIVLQPYDPDAPRVYAFVTLMSADGPVEGARDQIVRLQSERDFDYARFEIHAVWASGNSFADLISAR